MKCRGVMHRNPATSAAQYGMAQAVLSGASSAMPVDVARELVDKTPKRLRSKFARELHHNPMPLHDRLIHAVTEYDQKEEAKALKAKSVRGYYNRYALPHYIGAVQKATNEIERGVPVRKALTGHFTAGCWIGC